MIRKSFQNISLNPNLGAPLISTSLNETEENKAFMDEKELDSSVIETLQTQETKLLQLERNLDTIQFSSDCFNGTSTVPSSLLTEILKYDLKNYLNDKLNVRYSFFRRMSYENIMKWQGKEISLPLLKGPKELEAVSCQLFRNLLSYMGDRKSSKKALAHAKKHIKLTINADQQLKDEAFVQVLKQIKDHKHYDKMINGWNFFAILSSCYTPSDELYYSILNYLFFEIQNNSDKVIQQHANYVFVRLYQTKQYTRIHTPTELEITHIEHMKPLMIPVHFFSHTSTVEECESYTTARELKTKLMKRLQFNKNRIGYYCLYEICTTKDGIEERFIEDTDHICDILSLWTKDIEEATKKKEEIEFKFYLKLFLYHSYPESDVDTISFVFYQAVYDVLNGKYKLTEKDIITLAALQLLVEFSSNQDAAYQSLQKKVDAYVPSVSYGLNPGLQWVQKIMELYSTLNTGSKTEAKLTYIEHLKSSSLWEAHLFEAKYSSKNIENPENFPETVLLGIKPNGISVFDLDKNELDYFSYEIIGNWGISSVYLVFLLYKTEDVLTKYYFETPNTKIIQMIMESYTNLIAGKTISEVLNITSDYDKRFETIRTGRTRVGSFYHKTQ